MTRRLIALFVFLPWLCASSGLEAADAPSVEKKDASLFDLQDGCICEWLLLPGIPNSVNPKALASQSGYVEFVFGESKWQPRDGYALKVDKLGPTQPIVWKKTTKQAATVTMKEYGGKARTVSYAAAYVVVKAATDAWIEVAVPKYSAYLLVNGKPLDANGAAKLNEGYNALLLRMNDKDGDANFSVKVLDKNKKVDPAIRSALTPSAETEDRRARSQLQADSAFLIFPKTPGRVSYCLDVMTPQTHEMLGRMLECILKSQQANGAWSDTNFPDSVGVTALCCLALTAEGSLPRQGPHGKALDKGIEFLVNSFKEDGTCASKSVEGYGPMYGHALATLALLEVCGNVPWYSDLDGRISKALQVITRYQRTDGGWRYELTQTGESDTSVTTLVLWVLGEARKCGFTVPKSAMEKAVQFVEKCGLPDGRFSYRLNGEAKIQPHSGVGVAALYGAGMINQPNLPAARELVKFEYQRYSVDDLSRRRYLLFGSFFASLTLYSSGHKDWCAWYDKMTQVLARMQKPGGEVPDQDTNKIYPTALAAIILQAPYGYLSIYQQ